MDSGFRHFMDWWSGHRGHGDEATIREALCALMFNAEAYLHAMLSEAKTDTYLRQNRTQAHAIDADGAMLLSVTGSDDPLTIPHFGPGSPAATTGGPTGRVYVGEDDSTVYNPV